MAIAMIRRRLLTGLAIAWGVALVLGAGGVFLGVDSAAMLYLAMPPATLVVVWVWRRLGVAQQQSPATF